MNLKQLYIFGMENSQEPVIKNPVLRAALEGPRTVAQEPRMGLNEGGDAVKLKAQTEFYDTYGKDVIDKASKQKHGVTFNKLKDKAKRANFKKKFKKEFEKSGTFMTEGESRKFFRQKRVLREQDIQIKLLDATNKKGKFNAAKFAKDNDISMKVLKEQSDLLQGNIYDKRMLVSGKEMRSTLTWIPEDATISDNALIKLHKSGLITYQRNKIDELFYDAFGREYTKGTRQKNPAYNLKKYLAIKDNLNEYRQLKNAINAKYPSINFQLDHPLSKSTLNKIFNASADELTRVNILDASLNNNFKKSLSTKYENAVSSKNFRAKKAVESIAKDLNLNIGKVSKNLTGYEYGVKEFQKLNIKDEIIKSLKNQKDLNYNFKNYIKNNPELFKIAGFEDPSKIGTKLTKVTDKHIGGTIDILKKMGYRCRRQGGGAETVACYMSDVEKTRADMKSPNVEVRAKALTKQRKGLQLAQKIPALAKMLRRGIQGTLGAVGLTGPIGWAVEGLIEGGIYDYYRRKGYKHEQAFAETFTPRLAYEGFQGKSTEDVPWYGGAEKLREQELIGDPQQNPKVAHYVDALKEQDRIYSAIGKKEAAKTQNELAKSGLGGGYGGIPLADLDAASEDVQDLARSGAYRRVDQTLRPESMASQAYNTAVESQQALDQRRRREYLEKVEPGFLEREQESFDTKRHQEKRYQEMDEMFPEYSKEDIDYILLNMYGTSMEKLKGKGYTYKNIGKWFKDKDKSSYFADNFRMEKATGGIASLNVKK